MSEHKCDWCGAPDPEWLKHVDTSPVDTIYRQFLGRPGPTGTVYRACDACRPKMDECFPPGAQNL